MLRPKRQHASYGQQQQQQHPHHHGADDPHPHQHHHGALSGDDELLRMNPSLMTERQQLAFLLRKTALDASGGSDSHESSDASGDDRDTNDGSVARGTAGGRRIPRGTNKSSPRNTASQAAKSGEVVIYCGRGRPPKNSIKLPPGQTSEEYKRLLSPTSAAVALTKTARSEESHTTAPNRKKLKVTTATTTAAASVSSPDSQGVTATATATVDVSIKGDKTSPSSASDVLHMGSYEESASSSSGSGVDFWRLHCALCCDKTRMSAAMDSAAFFSDALFLCPSCDQKYPTQRALGIV